VIRMASIACVRPQKGTCTNFYCWQQGTVILADTHNSAHTDNTSRLAQHAPVAKRVTAAQKTSRVDAEVGALP
jgi:hypothetical protein